jgi:hypothetical protein
MRSIFSTGPVDDIRAELRDLNWFSAPRTDSRVAAPQLAARPGIGTDTAPALLVAARRPPDRLCNEATFAQTRT